MLLLGVLLLLLGAVHPRVEHLVAGVEMVGGGPEGHHAVLVHRVHLLELHVATLAILRCCLRLKVLARVHLAPTVVALSPHLRRLS